MDKLAKLLDFAKSLSDYQSIVKTAAALWITSDGKTVTGEGHETILFRTSFNAEGFFPKFKALIDSQENVDFDKERLVDGCINYLEMSKMHVLTQCGLRQKEKS